MVYGYKNVEITCTRGLRGVNIAYAYKIKGHFGGGISKYLTRRCDKFGSFWRFHVAEDQTLFPTLPAVHVTSDSPTHPDTLRYALLSSRHGKSIGDRDADCLKLLEAEGLLFLEWESKPACNLPAVVVGLC